MSLQVRSPSAGTVVIAFSGELDIANAPVIEAALLATEDSGVEEIVLDLTGVQFMGSVGLRVILEAMERAQAGGHRLTLRPGPAVRRVTDLTGLTRSLLTA